MSGMYLPDSVRYLINKLEAAGFRADAVGGCVRDALLGRAAGDYDVTTSATPAEMKAVFAGERLIETGIKHGTVSVVMADGTVEITTYRIDGEYLDSRHPESVSFTTDIKADLSRRDFTVNSMAYSERHGFSDFFGGKADLEKRIIRAVGEPERRFTEDALRILRALRFASVLDFEIEEKTSEALVRLAPRLSNVSAERIYVELMKLVGGVGAYRILKSYPSVIAAVLPELSSYSLPREDKFKKAAPVLRLAALFADKDEAAEKNALDRLRADNKTRKIFAALRLGLSLRLDNAVSQKLLLSKLGAALSEAVIDYRELLSLSDGEERAVFEEIIKSGACYSLSDLKIKGGDLSGLGIVGRETGAVLSALLASVISGELLNEREALLREAVKYLK